MSSPPRRSTLAATLALALPLAVVACAGPAAQADLVLIRGKVVTVDPALPVAARGGRIVAVGSSDDVAALVGPDTRVIDLGGRLVVPDFIEGHGHDLGLGQSRTILDLADAASFDDVVRAVAAAVADAEPGAWIQGRGWHQERWGPGLAAAVDGVPTHHALSAVSPANPVILGRRSSCTP